MQSVHPEDVRRERYGVKGEGYGGNGVEGIKGIEGLG